MTDQKKLPFAIFFGAAFLLLLLLWATRPKPQVEAPLNTAEPRSTAQTSALTPTRKAAGAAPRPSATLRLTGTPSALPEVTVTAASAQQALAGFFAAPDGDPEGDGSIRHPWDIETAFGKVDSVSPGSTLWLRGGMYGSGGATRYTVTLEGSSDAPIVIRGYPGERAIVDSGILAEGPWTWYWGFEITNTSSDRLANGAERPPGLYMVGRGQKAINMVIYNTGHPGIGLWSEVGDGGEIYGCIIWGVGTQDTDRNDYTRGSAIYAQNQEGSHLIREVISFRNLSTGMKAYAEKEMVNGFTFEGNISFENGDRLIFVNGTEYPVERLVLRENFTYRALDEEESPVRLGYTDRDQTDAVVQGNVFVNGTHEDGAFWVKRFRSLTFTGNMVVSPNILSTYLAAEQPGQITWDNNQYFGGSLAPFRVGQIPYPFIVWRQLLGFDANSAYTREMPAGTQVYVRPNEYDPARAHIAIYNWDMALSVPVDLSAVLKPGDSYEIRDAQDYFGEPVIQGTYDGSPVSIPMNLTEVSDIPGDHPTVKNVHTSPQFGAFVVIISPRVQNR